MDVTARVRGTEHFIERARAKHGDRFDYTSSRFSGFVKPIEVVCRAHGPYSTTPKSHLANLSGGCPKCREEIIRSRNCRTTADFVQRAQRVHGDRYDYDQVRYVNGRVPIVIGCSRHGPFRMRPYRHLEGRGCRKCIFERFGSDRRLPFWEFVERVIQVHGADRYDYALQDFVNMHSKIPIHCPRHGVFHQSVANHLKGTGCPRCIQSQGEQRIREALQILEVEFVEQAKFPDCRNRRELPFDFYVPNCRLLIEFDGRQHYDNSETWGGDEKLAEMQHHDAIKTRFAEEHGYRMLRIPYWEIDSVESVLLDQLAA